MAKMRSRNRPVNVKDKTQGKVNVEDKAQGKVFDRNLTDNIDVSDSAAVQVTENVVINGDPVEINREQVVTGTGNSQSSPAASTGEGSTSSTVDASADLKIDDIKLSAKGHVTSELVKATQSSLNDSASTNDSIGFSPYVNALSKLLCHEETNTPLVVGVYGEWGAGKTSFMSQLKDNISQQNMSEGRKNISSKQVWFNAWKYDNQSDLWIALLQAITSQVEKDTVAFKVLTRRFLRLVSWKFFINITFIFSFFGLSLWLFDDANLIKDASSSKLSSILPTGILVSALYFLGALKPTVALIQKMKNPLGMDINELVNGKDLPDRIESIRAFDKDLEDRLNDYLGENGRLIIYIDDLDRCSPDHAVEIIEAVNLFLETDRCIFVIGMDHKLISSSIELKYKDLSKRFSEFYVENGRYSEERSYGEFFLKKIIQVPLNIPTLTEDEVKSYIGSFIHTKEDGDTETIRKYDNETEVTKTDGDSTEITISLTDEMKEIIFTLLPYMEPNPRAIKRFYNMLSFIHFFYVANKERFNELNEASITIWFFLLYRYPNEIKQIEFIEETVTWNDLMITLNDNFGQISGFFEQYAKNNKQIDIIEKLDGSIDMYYQMTRILAL